MFSPTPRKHYLNITPNNIVRIYPPHSQEEESRRTPLVSGLKFKVASFPKCNLTWKCIIEFHACTYLVSVLHRSYQILRTEDQKIFQVYIDLKTHCRVTHKLINKKIILRKSHFTQQIDCHFSIQVHPETAN